MLNLTKMQPYYLFDSDEGVQSIVQNIKNLHRQICIGIARSQKQLFISKGKINDENQKLITYVSPKTWEDPRISEFCSEDLSGLTTNELKQFFQAYQGHYFNSFFIPIRSHSAVYDFTKSFNSKDTSLNQNAAFFYPLLEEIKKLPFLEIGRIFIIYTPPHQKEIWHIDYWPGEFYDGTRHFMWISNNKSLLIKTSDKLEAINSSALMFDFSLPHSTPSSAESSYSIRIEGQFNEDFCKRNNIIWKARF